MPAAQRRRVAGFRDPGPGARALGSLALCLSLAACGEDERTRILPPEQVAMNPTATVTSAGDFDFCEVKRGIAFPIVAPSDEARAALVDDPVEPYGQRPWVTLEDVRVQLSWTLTNLDDVPREVEVLVDPWNEFGRYWPGLTLVDAENGEFLPNLSGIDHYYVLEPVSAGEGSRRHGVYTYDDLDELARDFATVMNLIENPPTTYPGGQALEEGESALPTYVNHAFHFQNHSSRDPLVRDWVPGVIAGLTGVDVGLRSRDVGGDAEQRACAATIALEVVVEITDLGADKVREEGAKDTLLPPTETIITIGTQ